MPMHFSEAQTQAALVVDVTMSRCDRILPLSIRVVRVKIRRILRTSEAFLTTYDTLPTI